MNRIPSSLNWVGLFFLVGLFLPAAMLRAEEPPKWLAKAALQATVDVTPDMPATVLVNETVLTVDVDGRATREHRYAVRILTRAGLAFANGGVPYLDKKESVSVAERPACREISVVVADSCSQAAAIEPVVSVSSFTVRCRSTSNDAMCSASCFILSAARLIVSAAFR